MCHVWIFLILAMKNLLAVNNYGLQKLVVRGVDVDIEQYPYTAQVIVDRSSACGGAVISRRVIITAGHCVYSISDTKMVSAMDLDIYLGSSNSMQGVHYEACRVMKHPSYGKTSQDYFYDLGLILLTRPVKLSRRVKIAKIAPFNSWRSTAHSMTIAGFGSADNTQDLPKKMAVTKMRFVDPKICNMSQTADGELMPVPEHMFCMIGTTWTSDCKGDSGSAITWRQYIVGLVSLGRDSRDGSCGSESIPSMYTDLTYFRNWVKQNVRELEAIPTSECEESENLQTLKKQNKKNKLSAVLDDGPLETVECLLNDIE